ncbi:MAG TPA: thiamine phosphate synthase [Polyangiaceae bacterium]|nr:thiamine phosphate synthase [Polyangiaceae bacterium]
MTPLYPIIDLDTLSSRGTDPLRFAQSVLTARPAMLQLRAKTQSTREALEWLDRLAPLCRAHGTELYANDRPDLAVLAGASGVHVGQTDLPVSAVRRFSRQLKIGVSTHNLAQLKAALADRPDYVALGPIFATSSKQNPDPVVGWSTLEEASQLCQVAGIELVAIGGIEERHLPRMAELSVSVAVISALCAPSYEEVEQRARRFGALLGGAAGD